MIKTLRFGTLLPVIILSTLITPTWAKYFSEEVIDQLRDQKDQFEEINLTHKEGPLAGFHTISEEGVTIKGIHYRGARFKAPEWIGEDRLFWMITSPEFIRNFYWDYPWWIISLDDERKVQSAFRIYSDPRGGRYTIFKKMFPDREEFVQLDTREGSVRPGQEYLAVYAWNKPKNLDLKFAFTVGSDKGLVQCGRLPTAMPDRGPGLEMKTVFDEKPPEAEEIAEKAFATFKESGAEKTREFLDGALREYLARGGTYPEYQTALWQECQYRSGRTNLQWNALGFEYLARKSWELQAFGSAADTFPNAAMALMAVYNLVAAEQVAKGYRYKMFRRNMSARITDYPESWEPFDTFPDVKVRIIPLEVPSKISTVYPHGVPHGPEIQLLDHLDTASLLKLAQLEYLKGNWKEALEYALAVKRLVTRMPGFKKQQIVDDEYLAAVNSICTYLMNLGFYDEAYKLAEATYRDKSLKGGYYQWREHYIAELNSLECRYHLGTLDLEMDPKKNRPKDVEFGGYMQWRFNNLKTVQKASGHRALLVKIKVHLVAGSPEEQERARRELKILVNEEFLPARLFSIELGLEENRLDGLEEELISLLQQYRSQGRKIDEWKLYSFYGDLLFRLKRFDEALAMQREAIRLLRTFDLFPFEPIERMKLARILLACNQKEKADQEAQLARMIVQTTQRFNGPHLDRVKKAVEMFSMEVADGVASTGKLSEQGVSLQPQQALIVPIQGKPGEAKLTLGNLSASPVTGSLEVSTDQASMTYSETDSLIEVELGRPGANSISSVTLEPGAFQLISVRQSSASKWTGKFEMIWKSDEGSKKAEVTFGEDETGVSSALIDAGNYQLNAFFGIPVFHHFHRVVDEGEVDFRVTSSMEARIEVYDADDHLLFVDTRGNGSFLDPGDLMLSDPDSNGYPNLPVVGDETVIRLQVYPHGAPTEEGLEITVEIKNGDSWIPMSTDHLSFPGE